MPWTTESISQAIDPSRSLREKIAKAVLINLDMNICRLNLPSYPECKGLVFNLLKSGLMIATEISKSLVKEYVDKLMMDEDLAHMLEIHGGSSPGGLMNEAFEMMISKIISKITERLDTKKIPAQADLDAQAPQSGQSEALTTEKLSAGLVEGKPQNFRKIR